MADTSNQVHPPLLFLKTGSSTKIVYCAKPADALQAPSTGMQWGPRPEAARFLDLHLLLCISFRQLFYIPEFTSPFSQRTDRLNQNPFGMGVGGVWGTLTYTMKWKNAVGLSPGSAMVMLVTALVLATKLAPKEVWGMGLCGTDSAIKMHTFVCIFEF